LLSFKLQGSRHEKGKIQIVSHSNEDVVQYSNSCNNVTSPLYFLLFYALFHSQTTLNTNTCTTNTKLSRSDNKQTNKQTIRKSQRS